MSSVQLNQSGFLLIDKPSGITSQQCVAALRRNCSLKIGHTGTLDPMATGAMVISIGDATKFSRWIIEQKKAYTATIQLGSQTDTDDKTGEIIKEADIPHLSIDEITEHLKSFAGEITQIPPDYSAIHVNGQRAYKLARKSKPVALKSRQVVIEEIKLLHYQKDLGQLMVEIVCQSGTYIRSIARDLGQNIGCYAHLEALHRHWISPFEQETYMPLDDYNPKNIISLERAFANYPQAILDAEQTEQLYHGKQIAYPGQTTLAVYHDDRFIGMIEPSDSEHYRSIKLRRLSNE